ncbi:hypothetical protein [Streptomyces sp. NPDC050504]|uniref:hypothetical protein n=1 Tax=Streptomyces sp. NPDC050504 TaxID=3365618 RepID=UPI0037A4A097
MSGPSVVLIVLVSVPVLLIVVLVAALAGKLARSDGATYPAAFTRAGAVFAAGLTLAAVLTGALAQVLR